MFDVVVANGRFFGGGMKMCPDAVADDGLLDVVTIGDVTKRDLMLTMPKIYRGTHLPHPKAEALRGRVVTVETAEPVPVELDGEQPGTTPARFEVLPGAMRLRVPASTPRESDDAGPSVTIVQLTDCHLFTDPDGSLRDIATRPRLRRVIEDIRDRVPDFDFLVVTGDTAHDEAQRDLRGVPRRSSATGSTGSGSSPATTTTGRRSERVFPDALPSDRRPRRLSSSRRTAGS